MKNCAHKINNFTVHGNFLSPGTLFLEFWKRKQSELAYQWDVEQFEENEPDRPEFYGTKERVVSQHA